VGWRGKDTNSLSALILTRVALGVSFKGVRKSLGSVSQR